MHPLPRTPRARTAPVLLACASFAWTLLAAAGDARADAIVRSQAMFAGTIVEYHVEPGRVRVDLEISAADLPAFPNLLPDDAYATLGLPPRPLAERLEELFRESLVISLDGETPLPGRAVSIAPRERVRRDEITGEPLASAPGEEPELAVFARLEYATPERPARLVLHGPRGARPVSAGFVAYHEGVAVNDFRYLSTAQTLELDWQDPWYSRFERRALRRQYFAPMSAFLYVEPYEVRKEIVVRPVDLQRFVDLGIDLEADDRVLPAGRRAEVTRAIGEFLRDRQRVTIDGETPAPELARVNFLERSLRTSRVVEPGLDVDLHAAVVGAIFVYPTSGLPREVTLDWDLWDDRIAIIPAASVDPAGPLPAILEPEAPTLVWNNFLKNPRMPALAVVAAPPHPAVELLAGGAHVFGALVVLLLLARLTELVRLPRAVLGVGVAIWAVLLAARLWVAMGEDDAKAIVEPLLANVYHAFDFRGEDRIYDTLAASTDGPVLETAYLETRKGLELASQGGARAKVKEVELVDLELGPDLDEGFRARVVWNVAGSVGHWGHVHQRRNQYEAWMDVAPRDGAWKIVGLDLVREERQ